MQSDIYANVKVNVLLNAPLIASSHTNNRTSPPSANEQTGIMLPKIVTKKQGFRPTISLSLPNRGHVKNASNPRMHSVHPITIYIRP
mmetsp:Transcript_15126/g.18403  ORF Transcript_15126/g.18403 Transcript_15126/m.18403 type:complete len:87 (-) Transcript_15126:685-945(-)